MLGDAMTDRTGKFSQNFKLQKTYVQKWKT